jgi:hypothetical protein
MKIEKKYAGKWVAIKNSNIVESDKTLTKLAKKIEKRKDNKNIRFTLVPSGLIVG